jgi:regulator of protease activity HflC (stomatin/prohibitin superfamily)
MPQIQGATTFEDDLVPEPDAETPPHGWRARIARVTNVSASRMFIVLMLALFALVYFWRSVFITVGPGEVGVLYLRFFGGTQTDRVLGEGMKMVAPWDHIYVYDTRVQEVKHLLDVLSSEGLTVKLSLSIRYHPEVDLVGLLHQKVGPEYRDKIVIPEVESALRTTMGNFPMRDVYGSQRGLVQQALNEGLEKVEQKYVKIDGVVLREVTLPDQVRQSIEQKMSQKEIAESYEYRQEIAKKEADRLAAEAAGIKSYNDTVNSSLTPSVLRWEGIQATKELAKSPNAKTIIVGSQGTGGLPLVLGGGGQEP